MSSSATTARRVLLLDDEPSVLRTLVEYLRAPHLDIVTCSESEAAQCLMDRKKFDVLVTDLEVSNLGGLEGIRLIRHVAVHFPEMEVVVFSGKLTPEVRELGTALGVVELLEKPSDLGRLRELIGSGSTSQEEIAAGAAHGEVTHVNRLEEVLERQEISAVLQPIVSLDQARQSWECFGFEGLARGPEGSLLRSPEILLCYASRKEKLFETELQCIEAVLQEARHLPRIGKLFINVRPRSLSQPGFSAILGDLVCRHGLQPTDIVLELTEQQSILNLKAFDRTLDTLRNHGFGLALDDFGTGFANLHLVQQLPLDYLKIDGLFCRNIENDQRKQSIVHSTLELARELGIATIMERVETESELEIVRGLGASYAQGYYFSRPLPARDLEHSFRPRVVASREEALSGSEPVEWHPVKSGQEFRRHEMANLLTSIALFSEQGMKKVEEGDPLHQDLKQILAACEEAIALTE